MRERTIKETTMKFGKKFLFSMISAVLLAFSMPAMGTSVLVWFSFSILMVCLDGQKKRRGFLLGFIFGTVYFTICFWWILPTFVREIPKTFNKFPPIVGLFVFLLAVGFLGFYFGIYGFFFAFFSKKFEKSSGLLFLSSIALILFVEYLRSLPPLKFIGFRFSDALFEATGLLQLASIGGSQLLLILIAITNTLIFISYKRHHSIRRTMVLTTSLVLGIYCINFIIGTVLPESYTEQTETIKVAGVQTMITPLNKYRASPEEKMIKIEEFTAQVEAEQPDTELFVLPEAYFIEDVNTYPDIIRSLEDVAEKTNMTVVLPHVYTLKEERYNAVQFVDPKEGLLGMYYAKMELNPFSEYLPFEKLFQFLSFLKFKNYLDHGTEPVTLDIGIKAAFPICFEAYFPNVFATLKKAGADMYCVVTNDGYFTHKTALEQHFRQLQIRAVETRSWMCHVSNNGITGLIDPYGRILQESEPFVSSISYFDIPAAKTSETIYPYIYDYLYLFTLAFFSVMVVLALLIRK